MIKSKAPFIISIPLLIMFSICLITPLIADFTLFPMASPIFVPIDVNVFFMLVQRSLKNDLKLPNAFLMFSHAFSNLVLNHVGTLLNMSLTSPHKVLNVSFNGFASPFFTSLTMPGKLFTIDFAVSFIAVIITPKVSIDPFNSTGADSINAVEIDITMVGICGNNS